MLRLPKTNFFFHPMTHIPARVPVGQRLLLFPLLPLLRATARCPWPPQPPPLLPLAARTRPPPSLLPLTMRTPRPPQRPPLLPLVQRHDAPDLHSPACYLVCSPATAQWASVPASGWVPAASQQMMWLDPHRLPAGDAHLPALRRRRVPARVPPAPVLAGRRD